MPYLSKEIEAYTKRKQNQFIEKVGENKSLVKPEISCGIFQDYGDSPKRITDGSNL
ncbi:MAG: hypothetical protein ACFCUL_01530 [Flavobacteriaceae bacterium]